MNPTQVFLASVAFSSTPIAYALGYRWGKTAKQYPCRSERAALVDFLFTWLVCLDALPALAITSNAILSIWELSLFSLLIPPMIISALIVGFAFWGKRTGEKA